MFLTKGMNMYSSTYSLDHYPNLEYWKTVGPFNKIYR